MATNDLFKQLQSAYRPNHSIETAIGTNLNDHLIVLDSSKSVLLSLLDCSTAFDLISYPILLHQLQHRLGARGTTLKLFESYLTDRTQSI